MSKRRVAYIVGAVTVTSVSALAVFNYKNKYFEPLHFLNSKNAIDLTSIEAQTVDRPRPTNPPPNCANIKCERIAKARDLVLRFKDEIGAPGIVIGVSVNGRTEWAEGFGMSDVENRVACHRGTVMRIASISKSMTMAVVAKLWEQGKLDFDKPVQQYVPQFPEKTFDGKKVEITTRLLASHLGGIRHYTKKGEKESNGIEMLDTLYKEFYLKDSFENVDAALKLFQDDELMSEPGTSYHYTTHGWTLISAVVEGATKPKTFPQVMTNFFKMMGMKNTYLDQNDPIIYHRAKYYTRNKRGRLVNVPYADNSYKWAGGGFVSTVDDLLCFCNSMLSSYQDQSDGGSSKDQSDGGSYLRRETVDMLWTPHPVTQESKSSWGRDGGYGMGWFVVPRRQGYRGGGGTQPFSVGHSGGAVGASSVVLVVPGGSPANAHPSPAGVAVAVLTNMQDVGLHRLASEVAGLFASEDS